MMQDIPATRRQAAAACKSAQAILERALREFGPVSHEERVLLTAAIGTVEHAGRRLTVLANEQDHR